MLQQLTMCRENVFLGSISTLGSTEIVLTTNLHIHSFGNDQCNINGLLIRNSLIIFRYLSRLCQGSKGPCIWFQGAWLTPNEFQFISGRETAKVTSSSKIFCTNVHISLFVDTELK